MKKYLLFLVFLLCSFFNSAQVPTKQWVLDRIGAADIIQARQWRKDIHDSLLTLTSPVGSIDTFYIKYECDPVLISEIKLNGDTIFIDTCFVAECSVQHDEIYSCTEDYLYADTLDFDFNNGLIDTQYENNYPTSEGFIQFSFDITSIIDAGWYIKTTNYCISDADTTWHSSGDYGCVDSIIFDEGVSTVYFSGTLCDGGASVCPILGVTTKGYYHVRFISSDDTLIQTPVLINDDLEVRGYIKADLDSNVTNHSVYYDENTQLFSYGDISEGGGLTDTALIRSIVYDSLTYLNGEVGDYRFMQIHRDSAFFPYFDKSIITGQFYRGGDGDVNDNGILNSIDALMIKNYLLYGDDMDRPYAADIDGDGSITISDAEFANYVSVSIYNPWVDGEFDQDRYDALNQFIGQYRSGLDDFFNFNIRRPLVLDSVALGSSDLIATLEWIDGYYHFRRTTLDSILKPIYDSINNLSGGDELWYLENDTAKIDHNVKIDSSFLTCYGNKYIGTIIPKGTSYLSDNSFVSSGIYDNDSSYSYSANYYYATNGEYRSSLFSYYDSTNAELYVSTGEGPKISMSTFNGYNDFSEFTITPLKLYVYNDTTKFVTNHFKIDGIDSISTDFQIYYNPITKEFSYDSIHKEGEADVAQNLTYDAANHQVDIDGGGTSATIPLSDDDGATEGLASFTAADFDVDVNGNVAIDYAHGQEATSGADGFLSAKDWLTFSNKLDWEDTTAASGVGIATYDDLRNLSLTGDNLGNHNATDTLEMNNYNIIGAGALYVGKTTGTATAEFYNAVDKDVASFTRAITSTGTVGAGVGINFQRARLGMTAVAAGDVLGLIRGRGYDGSAFDNATNIQMVAQTVNSGNIGGQFIFRTSNYSGTVRSHLWINSNGRVGIETSTPDLRLEIADTVGSCLRLTYGDYDGTASNKTDFTVSSTGDLTITPSGGDINLAGEITNNPTNITLDADNDRFIVYDNSTGKYGDISLADLTSAYPLGNYAISLGTATASVTNGITWYVGTANTGTSSGYVKVYIPKTGTIKSAYMHIYCSTAGDNSAWKMEIEKNGTSYTEIETVSTSAQSRTWDNASLNIAVSAGDWIAVRVTNPTWGTNPATPNGVQGVIFIEY